MNLIGVFVTKLWPVQALACGGGGGGDGGDGGATKNIISPKFSNFGDIITTFYLCRKHPHYSIQIVEQSVLLPILIYNNQYIWQL